ncbi:MAG TPA: LssY C-terminal domain-containing protein [Candidatus Paceibacterota bacterium]|nr:LssY C-terminal domain-containing protein [Candidatus Paceibacterota bacterium]
MKLKLKFVSFLRFLKKERRSLVRGFFRHMVFFGIVGILLYSLALYGIFFLFNSYAHVEPFQGELPVYASVDDVEGATGFLAYRQQESQTPMQPVNLILIGPSNMQDVFHQLSWIPDVNFSLESIPFSDFLRLLKEKTPPISDLYVDGQIQNSSFQNQSDSLWHREHVRLWRFGTLEGSGQSIYLASVSADAGIDFASYRDFIVPLHEISPNIDVSRDHFLTLVKAKIPGISYVYKPWGLVKKRERDPDGNSYYTDGKVLVITFPKLAST